MGPTEGMRKEFYRMKTIYSVFLARKSRNICEPRFQVKDFFEFIIRLLVGDGIVRSEPADILQLAPPALEFGGGQLRPEHLAHEFV